MKVHVRVDTIEDKIAEFVENHPVEIYIDYRDELTDKQVELLLEGRKDEVICDIEDWAMQNSYEGEFDSYWDEMCESLNCTREDVDDWLSDVDGFYPGYYLDDHGYKQLLRNSSAHITCTMWDVNWNFNGWAYGQPIEYSDVKEALKILGVNPKEFRDIASGGSLTSGPGKVKGYFPNMPNREPKVVVKDLYENMIVLYDGVLNFCLGDLENAAECLEGDPEYITFRKGTNVVMYDFGGGAGITDVALTADVTVKRKDVDIRSDSSIHYGIQECYGFTNSFWEEGSIRHGK